MNEQVMVVAREDLAAHLVPYGLVRDGAEAILDAIVERHFFIDRPTAEVSPQYKQIIPYVVIRNGDAFFLLQRTPKQTEARLHHKYSIGIGGHVNPDTPELIDGLVKELDEEVTIDGDYEISFVGILNDDSTEVGSVHLGTVFALESASRDVRVAETEKMVGRWATVSELTDVYESMETWSQIVFDAYVRMQNEKP
ncbi:MAG TPA: NUDIX domain-containing protein [Thermoanaerobaculia bacterium]|nr:NUDIX domain-containing protein [Thermoanaerobaculia bacterium]